MNEKQIKMLNEMIVNKKKDYMLLSTLLPYGLKIWKKILGSCSLNELFEIDDGYAIVYNSYNEVLNEFIKYKLNPYMFLVKFGIKIELNSKNYLRAFLSNSHHVLNFYLNTGTLSSDDENNHLVDFINNKNSELNAYLSECKTHYQKKILLLKYQGYSNLEISKMLNLKKKKVDNDMYVIKKHIKNHKNLVHNQNNNVTIIL